MHLGFLLILKFLDFTCLCNLPVFLLCKHAVASTTFPLPLFRESCGSSLYATLLTVVQPFFFFFFFPSHQADSRLCTQFPPFLITCRLLVFSYWLIFIDFFPSPHFSASFNLSHCNNSGEFTCQVLSFCIQPFLKLFCNRANTSTLMFCGPKTQHVSVF